MELFTPPIYPFFSFDSISLTNSVHNVKEFSITSMTGSYRRVFQRPKDYEWELISYVDRNLPLAQSDLHNLLKSQSVEISKEEKIADKSKNEDSLDSTDQSVCCKKNIQLEAGGKENENGQGTQDPQMALKLSFTLPASSYATMAIRELLKTSTSGLALPYMETDGNSEKFSRSIKREPGDKGTSENTKIFLVSQSAVSVWTNSV
uniref:TRUD domain-containing protein n=1 Tax=Cucumis sativus TaxID=3659 RepID=A0A0A0LYD2_CUCSA